MWPERDSSPPVLSVLGLTRDNTQPQLSVYGQAETIPHLCYQYKARQRQFPTSSVSIWPDRYSIQPLLSVYGLTGTVPHLYCQYLA